MRRTPRAGPVGRALAVLVVLALGVATVALAVPAVDATTEPTVAVGSATVAPGERVTLAVTLSSAPEGLSGYDVTVSVTDTTVARVVGADIPTSGIQNVTVLDNGTVEFRAVDLVGRVDPGASDVPLGTLTVIGDSPGETAVTVTPNQVDADDGSVVDPRTADGTVRVTSATGPDPATGTAVRTTRDGDSATVAANGDERSMSASADAGSRDLDPVPFVVVGGAAAAVFASALLVRRGRRSRRGVNRTEPNRME